MPDRVKEKLVELANDVLRYLPWGEIQKDTAERIADRMMDHGVTVQEWISVKDRLPEYGERVLACGAKGGVFMVRATTTPGFGKVDGASKYRTFDYWMPLPQPPKGE